MILSIRCLAFDYGLRYMGVAVGDVATKTADPLNVLVMQKGQPNWQELDRLLGDWEPDILLVGCPLKDNGKEQSMSTKARVFAKEISLRYKIPAKMVDERYTTVSAKADIFSSYGAKGLKGKRVDSVCAEIICLQWIEEQR